MREMFDGMMVTDYLCVCGVFMAASESGLIGGWSWVSLCVCGVLMAASDICLMEG